MHTIYAVSATVTRKVGTWESTRQLPTFYLDSRIQGIVSEDHAERIAAQLFDWSDASVSLTVVGESFE